jgi:flavin-dependent dehydrogenase
VRAELDDFCLQQALRVGAQFNVVSRVSSITTTSSHVEVETSGGSVTASFVIGADGVNSVVRKLSDQFHEIQTGLAVEACIPWSSDAMPAMEFDFGVVAAGYGWVFPKHDHVNVGLYTNLAILPLTRAALREYALKRLGRDDIGGFIGQKIGLNGAAYRPTSQRVFLVGDAAGFVDPLLGEGIYNAIKSGQAAAAAVVAGVSNAAAARGVFEARLRPIRKDAASCAHSAERFYGNLRLGYRALISPVPKYALMRGFAAGKTFHFTKRFFFLLPFVPVRARIQDPSVVNAAE